MVAQASRHGERTRPSWGERGSGNQVAIRQRMVAQASRHEGALAHHDKKLLEGAPLPEHPDAPTRSPAGGFKAPHRRQRVFLENCLSPHATHLHSARRGRTGGEGVRGTAPAAVELHHVHSKEPSPLTTRRSMESLTLSVGVGKIARVKSCRSCSGRRPTSGGVCSGVGPQPASEEDAAAPAAPPQGPAAGDEQELLTIAEELQVANCRSPTGDIARRPHFYMLEFKNGASSNRTLIR